MIKSFFIKTCLFTLLWVGLQIDLHAQDSRRILVVSPYANAVYKAEDQNKLQSILYSFRQKYGLVVQGYDKSLSGYLIFSSQTNLATIPEKEIEALKSEIKEVYPQSVFLIKQQEVPVHTPKDTKQPSAKNKKQ